MSGAPPGRRVEIWEAAKRDIERLTEDDARLGPAALGVLRSLERGGNGIPLEDLPKYGDLSDCRKVYFGIPGGPRNTHRVVYQEREDGLIEVLEVVAVEARHDGYAYLLAAQRLGRLPGESKPEFDRLHQQAIQRRGARRRPGP